MRKRTTKIIALLSSCVLWANIVATTTISPVAAKEESVALPAVILSSADVQGEVDLSQLGGIDWIHTSGDAQERKGGIDSLLQMTVCTTPQTANESIGNSPLTFLWNDGTHSETGSTANLAALYWKKGQTDSVNVTIAEEVGYRITLPAFDYPVVLSLISGVHHAEADLFVFVNGEETPMDNQSYSNSENTPNYTKHTLNIRSGNSVELVYTLSRKTAADGALLFGAVALDKLKLTDAVKVSTEKVGAENNRLNLTETGDLDWLHLTGTTGQDTTSTLVQTRKANNTPLISFAPLKDVTGLLVQNDNAVGYSWTADDSSSKTAYNSQPKSSKGLVISWRNGDSSTIGQIPDTLEVGGEISIPAADSARTLTFVAGAFQSKSEFSIYLNDNPIPAYQGVLEVFDPTTNIYTVKLSAKDSAVIKLRTIQKYNSYGNLFLGGITLGIDHQGLNLKSDLASLVKKLDEYTLTGMSGHVFDVFEKELDHAKTVLEQSNVSNETYYETKLFLQAAFDEMAAYIEDMSPEFYSPNTRNWLYFGWENDPAKSLSTMGGAMYPGGANGSKAGQVEPIRYTVSVDGVEYKPDESSENRRINTQWYQADGYMNSPVSVWDAGNTGIEIKIQHVPNRVLDDSVTAVFSQITLTNTTDKDIVTNLNISASSAVEVPLTASPTLEGMHFMVYRQSIPAGETCVLDFAALSTGTATVDQLKTLGSFDDQYVAVKSYYDAMLDTFAAPISLPDQEMVDSYLNSMIVMWETMVQVSNGDYEIRGDAGNRCGVYNYDRYFSHDVPNMVEQFIRDGHIDLAKRIMESSYYQRLAYNPQQGYLDAIPKYIIPYATLWQVMSDKERAAYFTDDVKNNIKSAAKNIATFMTGPNGLMSKSNTLDNGSDYLVVDNFAVMHGYAAYAYLCAEWAWTDEAAWADERTKTINNALNLMLDEAMTRRDVDWYMCALEDNSGFWTRYEDGSVIYDGNWLGTTFMMSTFPWDAVLRGYELGGTWADYLDASLDNAFSLKDQRGDIPENSWGAWWGHEYGAVYNVGMSVPLLYSEKYRTLTAHSYEWMLDNQSAPFQWGESFDKGQNDTDWTRPAAGYETWGLGFMRQGLLEATASVKTDGTVIIGRGIPNEWMASGTPIEWQNIVINQGRKFSNLKLYAADSKTIKLELTGDDAWGDIVFNLPLLKNNIASVSDGQFDNDAGTVTVSGNTKELTVTLKDHLFEPTVKWGDVDSDGTVSAQDALLALQASTAKIALSAAQQQAADVNKTPGISSEDALLILQYSTKKISRFPIEG